MADLRVDTDVLQEAGESHRQVADAIETAARRLREIAGAPDMESEAVEAFVGKAEEVASDIDRAHERYRGVGDALYTYGFDLGDAQAAADDALRQAARAREDAAAARARLDSARQQLQRAQDDDAAAPPDAPPADLTRARSRDPRPGRRGRPSASAGPSSPAPAAPTEARRDWPA